MIKLKVVLPYANPFWLDESDYKSLLSSGYSIPGVWKKTVCSINAIVKKYNAFIEPIQGAIIADNREIGVRDYQEFDYILFVDSDISFAIGDIDNLLARDLDFVSGIYRMRDCNSYSYFINNIPQKKINTGIQNVDYCGLGFTLIKTKIFKYLDKPYFGGIYEDNFFCKNMKNNGFETFVDTNCIVEHNNFKT